MIHLFLELIADTVFFTPHLLLSPQSLGRKASILFTYLRLTLKLVFLNRLFRLRDEKILGFRVSCLDYYFLHLFFRIIFLRNEYFFQTEKKNPLILDCGENIGLATLFFKQLYPESEIHAFEPEPETFKMLKRNVEQNRLDNVYLYNLALSDQQGQADFYVDKQQPGAGRQTLKFARMPKDSVRVQTMPLSTIIEDMIKEREIDFFKLDVEGVENQVMHELSNNNKLRQIKQMYIEYHHRSANEESKLAPFLHLIEAHGFEYQIDTYFLRLDIPDKFQNILIRADRACSVSHSSG